MKPQFDFEAGEILLFDKPFDWSSFDVVKKIRYLLKKKAGKEIKVGHAGTLDPYATGLLILCTGKATKKIEAIQAAEKEYTGIIQLGATTPSFDLETEPVQSFPTAHITQEEVQKVLKTFIGPQMQLAPAFSAKMINGKRAYELARKGKEVDLKPHAVIIYELEASLKEDFSLHFRVRCSKGTYIRTLANDIGKALHSGGYLSQLSRTAIGPYQLKDAWSIEAFIAMMQEE
ncbi:MAG: tRNA pseudouridine(55) synthase TruB [Flavobacteriales bacterium]|nr:tRNA pseudouridine(55) synthase TruB [Flavobacteriales bacterium]